MWFTEHYNLRASRLVLLVWLFELVDVVNVDGWFAGMKGWTNSCK